MYIYIYVYISVFANCEEFPPGFDEAEAAVSAKALGAGIKIDR